MSALTSETFPGILRRQQLRFYWGVRSFQPLPTALLHFLVYLNFQRLLMGSLARKRRLVFPAVALMGWSWLVFVDCGS